MPIQVDAYISAGVASGLLARPGHLREVLEQTGQLPLERVRWQPLDAPSSGPTVDLAIPSDDVLIAVADEDPAMPVHATWHAIRLEIGPYVVEGEMPTLPGFDPGRALTRPTGEFVLLRDVRLGRRDVDGELLPIGQHALINRYDVEQVQADLMLGFFFPGAALAVDDAPSVVAAGTAVETPAADSGAA
jgi:hypothetical protein